MKVSHLHSSCQRLTAHVDPGSAFEQISTCIHRRNRFPHHIEPGAKIWSRKPAERTKHVDLQMESFIQETVLKMKPHHPANNEHVLP